MLEYPKLYDTKSHSSPGIANPWTAVAPELPEIVCAIPPEFHGPGHGYAPEELYALSMSTCFIATFKVIAEKSRAIFTDVSAAARLTVDRDEAGNPWMAKFNLRVSVTGAQNPELIERLLEKTSQSSLILNSVKTEITFDFEIA